jgi:hypothetical protein
MHIVKMWLVLRTVIAGKKMALKLDQTAPKSKWLRTILCSHFATYSQRKMDMTKLAVVSPPKHPAWLAPKRYGGQISPSCFS